ncbi:fibrillarin-like rRNA/tRNA 2'-O-methyltransferase [Candidatus Woesearchaeota archaeon]|nr:MAG: fibrillarin-like protein pre-rRNA processing protein [archaeon GW2011_AR4]MBS3130139.1 fibrillarin-like rRNA/tRNA 2'-O-methyltransferase [Candidatus Woesearchaeota archaeon]HIH38970.1 fibrillarin-like rRNA/tRNA 2'-O-methyltransferase [Candidatus Woesearchaeota archaeon]HIH48997.1 fibrillarin-like rRNA/tRNA 2'-O-methyltransferase [Candidatus Woesearchaeota archaeon]HIJ04112.1 fibrillarin-like rRNA/tRNA 2'-O-methyltransferase [Candidatus Woesearchaeota archaeon]
MQNIQVKNGSYFTRNLVPGQQVYDEDLISIDGKEYRSWNPFKSKLLAAIKKGMKVDFHPDSLLYLGASTGTTVSHVSDMFPDSFIFAVEFAPRVCRDLILMAEKRNNISVILADASDPDSYRWRILQPDFLYQDVAQRHQVTIFLKNVALLKKGSLGMLMVKARSIDVSKQPKKVFDQVERELKPHVEILDKVTLEPFQQDHCCFFIKKS